MRETTTLYDCPHHTHTYTNPLPHTINPLPPPLLAPTSTSSEAHRSPWLLFLFSQMNLARNNTPYTQNPCLDSRGARFRPCLLAIHCQSKPTSRSVTCCLVAMSVHQTLLKPCVTLPPTNLMVSSSAFRIVLVFVSLHSSFPVVMFLWLLLFFFLQ